jgi:MarR family transcriptional regulator, 2-MHQ and catechol-resistance regulon repressor
VQAFTSEPSHRRLPTWLAKILRQRVADWAKTISLVLNQSVSIMPSHFTGTPDERRALSAFINLMRATEAVTQRLHGPLAAAQLTMSQFGVLEALLHLGPLTHQQLAAKILRTPGNLTGVVDQLETRDLVRRQRRADDRRCVTVRLTPAGEALIIPLFAEHAQRVAADFGILTPAEQDALRLLCRTLGRQQRAESPVPDPSPPPENHP